MLHVGQVDQALARAETAAQAAGVTVRLAGEQLDARRAVDLFDLVWGRPDGASIVSPELAWALAHEGNYVALAERDGDLIGASLAFRAHDEDGPHLHSHLAAVRSGAQGKHVGFALKLHQRWWALSNGYDRVTWTFDPLVARNAYFNVSKLGAELTRYYRDFYGPLNDSVNTDDETDRFLVTWRLTAPGASHPHLPEEADVLLRVAADGRPSPGAGDGRVRLCQVPADIVALRQAKPALAREWRLALRSALESSFATGYRVGTVTREGWYVLTR